MTQHPVDLLILGSNQTVTVPQKMDDDADMLGIIDDGGVAVDKGRIVQAAASEYLERKYRSNQWIDATGTIILPGFVDPHTHLVFGGSREEEFQYRITGREYLQTLRGGGGIIETLHRTREATIDQLFQDALQRLNMALQSGTTTIEVKTGYGLDLPAETKMLQVVKQLQKSHPSNVIGTFLGAHAVPPEHPIIDEYVNHLIQLLLPAAWKIGGATFCDVFCEKGVFTPEQSLRVLRAAMKLGYQPKIHADEFKESGGARVANIVKAVSADHLVHSPEEELIRMNETSVTPVLLPGSSHSLLMESYAPARKMLGDGLPVALGTDFNPGNWMLSQLETATFAARDLHMKAEEIIRGITTNAARALRLENRAGSIAPGMPADLVLLKVSDYKWVGYAHPDGLEMDKVLIRGKTVVEDGGVVR